MSSELLANISSSPYFTNTTFAFEKAIEHTPAGVAVSGTITALVSARLLYKECNKTSRNFQMTRAVMYGGLCALGVMVTANTVMNMFGITIPMPNFSKPSMNETLGNSLASKSTVVREKILKVGVFNNKTMCGLEKVVTPAPVIRLPVCLLSEAPQVEKSWLKALKFW